MKREFIKELLPDITKEALDAIMAENGKDIERYKSEAEAANETKKTLESTIAEYDKQLEELKKVDAEGLKAKIEELQTANTTAKTEYENQLKQIKLDAALETRLIKEGAVNTKAVRALLDVSKISLDGENLVGLDEQLKALKESEKWAFSTQQTAAAGTTRIPGGGAPASGASVADEIKATLYGGTT
jgi:hypothetical protein